MTVLTEALWLGGTHDQLNLPCLQSFEKISRRIQTIIEAHRGGQGANWKMSKYLSGDSSAADGVAPELRAYAWRRAKDESDINNTRTRVLGAQASAGTDGDAGAGDADGGAKTQGRGAAGRGRRGRGAQE